VGREWTLEQFVEWLSTHQALYVYLFSFLPHSRRSVREGLTNSQIKKPSLSYASGQPLFYQAPPQLHELTKGNLEKLMVDLVSEGDEVVVTDPALPFTLNVVIKYE
jgi:ubiquitin-activating enzyme E1 C